MAAEKITPRIIVPFTFISPNTDNPGLKDFTPAIQPVSALDLPGKSRGAGDDESPKVSFVQESAPSSPMSSGADVPSEREDDPASAEKVKKELAEKGQPKE